MFQKEHSKIIAMIDEKHNIKQNIEHILFEIEKLKESLETEQIKLAVKAVDIDRYACSVAASVIDDVVGKRFMKSNGKFDRYYADSIVDRDKCIICMINETTSERVQISIADLLKDYFEV